MVVQAGVIELPVRSDTPNLFHDDVKGISRESSRVSPHETSCKPLTPVCATIIQSVVDMCAPSRCFYQSWIYKPNTLTESQRQWWCVIVVTLTVDQSFPQSLVKMVKLHMVFVFLLVNSNVLSWWVGGAKSLFKNHVLFSVHLRLMKKWLLMSHI